MHMYYTNKFVSCSFFWPFLFSSLLPSRKHGKQKAGVLHLHTANANASNPLPTEVT